VTGPNELTPAGAPAARRTSVEPGYFVPSGPDDDGLPPAPWSIIGSSYFRLWIAQVVSSLGDWIGLVAVLSLAARVSDQPEAAAGLVMIARMVPGFFLAPIAGVIVDRMDRKRLMVVCDLGRAVILALLPFVGTLVWLFIASFVLEVLTLLWGPAKDASVPNIVPPEKLPHVNSLNLAAAFGTFPLAAAIFAGLSEAAQWLSRYELMEDLGADQEFLALWLDSITFVTSALIVATMAIPRSPRAPRAPGSRGLDWTQGIRDLKEGFQFIGSHRLVRAVMLGLGAGLIGGGAVIPLGKTFALEVLGAGSTGYGILLAAMGTGGAAGVIGLSMFHTRLKAEWIFATCAVGTGVALIGFASVSTLGPAVFLVAAFGLCAGATYVGGFTVLQQHVEDELRGRTFATLYTLIRFCLIVSLVVSPLIAAGLDGLSSTWFDRTIGWGAAELSLPGTRLTLWLGGGLVVIAGLLARREVRAAQREATERRAAAVEGAGLAVDRAGLVEADTVGAPGEGDDGGRAVIADPHDRAHGATGGTGLRPR
jgi:MFS family permease